MNKANYKKINYKRIKILRDDIIDCLSNLDIIYNRLINCRNSVDKKIYIAAFRQYLISYRELIFSTVSHLCKTLYMSVGQGRTLELIKSCIDVGYFTVSDIKFYKVLNTYRVSAAPRYEQPTVEELLDFYKEYNSSMQQIVDDLNNILNKSKK